MSAARSESLVFTVVVAVIAGLAAIPMGLVLMLNGGGPIVLVAGFLALLPVAPVVGCYLWLDRYEPEPKTLLALGLAWGAFVATLAALVVQTIGSLVFPLPALGAVLLAPLTEELTKGLFLLLLLLWRRHELDGVLDGIVYAGMVGVGFAFTENILYLSVGYNGSDGMPGGTGGMVAVFVMRCIGSPFAHPFFTAFIGIGIGLAISSRNPAARLLLPLAGYAVAVLCHAAWNASTLIPGGLGFVAAYVVVFLPAFGLMIGFAMWVRGRERGLLTLALQDAAQRGYLDPREIAWVVDLSSRRAARRHARASGGTVGLAAMREYQQAAIELGYLHHRFLAGTAPRDFAGRGGLLVARLQAVRPRISFPQQQYAGGLPA